MTPSNPASDLPRSVLIVGGANTGKTVYVLQLYGRLSAGDARLRLRFQPADLSLIVAGFDRLSGGLSPEHTTSGARADIALPLVDGDGNAVDVLYPDYAGEQVDDMIDERRVSPEWKDRVRASTTWIVFVRLDHLSDPRDVVTSPPDLGEGPVPPPVGAGATRVDQPPPDGASALRTRALTDQARIVEGLQLLLHIFGAGMERPIGHPPLTVVLSCWDELSVPEGARPQELLRDRLPLVEAFVRANWEPDAVACFGLSAQGKAFNAGVPDVDFIDHGPESMGYIVAPDGRSNPDLTLILHDALRRARRTTS